MTNKQALCQSIDLWTRRRTRVLYTERVFWTDDAVEGSTMRGISTGLAILVLSGTLDGASSEAAFSRKPSVSRAGGKTVVSFAVAASTDVEVSVLISKGAVLRHLAAGLLGGTKSRPSP
jgi:hypothetical protein